MINGKDTDQIYVHSKDPGELIPLIVNLVDADVTASSASVSITVAYGNDPAPQDIIYNGPLINVEGTQIIVLVQGGITGVTYKIKLTILCNDGTRYTMSIFLPVQVI
jgi:hypothetical protein